MKKVSLWLLLITLGAFTAINLVNAACNSADGVLVEDFGPRTEYIDLGHRWSNALVRTKDSVYGAVITPKNKLPKKKDTMSSLGLNRSRTGKFLVVAEGCDKDKIKWRIEETYSFYDYQVSYRSVLQTSIPEHKYQALPSDCKTNCWVFDKEKLWYKYANGKPVKVNGKYVKVMTRFYKSKHNRTEAHIARTIAHELRHFEINLQAMKEIYKKVQEELYPQFWNTEAEATAAKVAFEVRADAYLKKIVTYQKKHQDKFFQSNDKYSDRYSVKHNHVTHKCEEVKSGFKYSDSYPEAPFPKFI